MIKINEARLGNFLLFDLPNGARLQQKVERINNSFDGFKFSATINDTKIERIYGILITDSWLAKLGFKKIERQFQHNWIIKLSKKDAHYSIQFFDDKFWLSNSEYDAWCYVVKEMEYVHQLQNLFYDLTDEELVAK